MKKFKKSNTPRRKRLNRKQRLPVAAEWLKSNIGKNVVKRYAKWSGVDLLCAIAELRILGQEIGAEYEENVRRSVEDNARERKMAKHKAENDPWAMDTIEDAYYFASGYVHLLPETFWNMLTHDEQMSILYAHQEFEDENKRIENE